MTENQQNDSLLLVCFSKVDADSLACISSTSVPATTPLIDQGVASTEDLLARAFADTLVGSFGLEFMAKFSNYLKNTHIVSKLAVRLIR